MAYRKGNRKDTKDTKNHAKEFNFRGYRQELTFCREPPVSSCPSWFNSIK